MSALSKRSREARGKIDAGKHYPLLDALNLLKRMRRQSLTKPSKWQSTLVSTRENPTRLSGGRPSCPREPARSSRWPYSRRANRPMKPGPPAPEYVGMQDLAEQIQGGLMDFNVVIAAPNAMPVVGKLGKLLGPRA